MARSSSCDHRVYQLPPHTVDHNDRFGRECATGTCTDLPTMATSWTYTTGRAGRRSQTTREVCTTHARRFAAKHGLVITDGPPPRQPSVFTAAVAAMTARPVDRVRVCNPRGTGWYLDEHHTGPGLIAGGSRWLAGVTKDATLEEAIAEAQRLLARDRRVPAGPWHRTGDTAEVQIVGAYRADPWRHQPWQLVVSCTPEGMWQLSRSLDERFPPLVDDLGNHHMSLQRALRVATTLLTDQGWTTAGTPWTTTADTATQTGWHPDQAPPGAHPHRDAPPADTAAAPGSRPRPD